MSFLHDRRTFADLIGRAPAPEFVQRLEQTRRTNIAMAQRRLLDRETYKSLRQFIRCPVDRIEAERNARWETLRHALQARHYRDLIVPSAVRALHLLRAHPGQALSHVIAYDGVPVEFVGEPSQGSLL